MAVQIRFHPLDLTTGAEYELYTDATHYHVLEDNTVEIRQSIEAPVTHKPTYRVLAHIHPDRWDSVQIVDEVSNE